MALTEYGLPERFLTGTRVLQLTGRNKDGVEKQRVIHKIATYPEQLHRGYNELLTLLRPNERIYISAVERDIRKASFTFKEKLLKAQFENREEDFFISLQKNWVSSLMAVTSQVKENKVWLFDCDTEEEYYFVRNELDLSVIVCDMKTKNGRHVFTKPFDRSILSKEVLSLLQDNPMALMAYRT